MKKILSAVLAASMVASMGVSAFAAVANGTDAVSSVFTTPYVYNFDEDDSNDMTKIDHARYTAEEDYVPYGTTLYYSFRTDDSSAAGTGNLDNWVHESDAVKSVSIRQSWEMGREFVESISIVKKKVSYLNGGTGTHTDGEKYFYFLAVEFEDSTSDDVEDVIGTITLKKTSGDEWAFPDVSDDNSIDVDINIELGYTTDDTCEIGSTYALHEFSEDSEDYITFTASDCSYFIVDTCDQDDLVAKFNTTYNAEITAMYPNAYLDFFNGYGLTFNKIGEMNLGTGDYDDEEGYLYELKGDTLVPVAAEYDEYEGVYRFYTRTIGSYVISDVELDIVEEEVEVEDEVEEEVVVTPPTTDKVNPGTGAIA